MTGARRRLGASDLEISPIGLGAWAIGGPWLFGWGPQDDDDSIAAIERAVELGLNWIDTAPAYGLGRSEEVVARALSRLAPSRRPYVFTKCSLVWDEERNVTHSLAPDSLRRECEASLRRLAVEAIDLYQIHWPHPPDGGEEGPIEEAWATLAALRAEGKVRWIGVSNFDAGQLARVSRIAPVTSLQPPYSMVRRGIEEAILPWCAAHGTGTIVYSPMGAGLLTGAMTRERIASLPEDDWRKRFSPELREPRLTANLELVECLAAIGARHGRGPGEVAVGWTLAHPAVTAAIVGARNARQVDGIAGALTFRLAAAEVAEIEAALARRAERIAAAG